MEFKFLKKNSDRFPFNWKSPIGYLIAVALQFQMGFLPLRYMQCFLNFAIAAFLFSFSTVKDFKNDIIRFDKIAKSKHKTQLAIMGKLNELGICSMNLRKLGSLIH